MMENDISPIQNVRIAQRAVQFLGPTNPNANQWKHTSSRTLRLGSEIEKEKNP
ncbi:MAG: hypothetical protein Kow0042_06170 [Calditrichia bacterium]